MSSRAVAIALGLGLGMSGPMDASARASAVQPGPVEETEPSVVSGDELEVAEADEAVAIEEADAVDETPSEEEPAEADEEPVEAEAEPAAPAPEAEFDPDAGFAPGGYYGRGEILEREPPDGYRHIVAGSILVPLGILSTVSSGVGVWMTNPTHCTERLAAVGREVEDPENCRPVFVFNVIRTTYGALMLVSGSVILSLGLLQRQRYRKWKLEHGMRAWVQPPIAGRPGAAGLRFRF